ncbi:dehydrodolichyl diphosphate synthetase [Moniliophthora roreri MCA 2997]|uniref:Alkyl transferase n=1 Tax=Moniliophthora roreri (strain MCA 2997) TaxID=1381753 RepID=V2XQU5_MONRO|nr:dehydrodolichyl diphosphate synthetase [Moniliophthora roreri MCA 2997]
MLREVLLTFYSLLIFILTPFLVLLSLLHLNSVKDYPKRLLLKILAAGPVPQHVAFVMDGNRRYARMLGKGVKHGHGEGYESLRRVLEICFRLNIRCVSVYAFAIENFKRSKEEVDALMVLAVDKLDELCRHGDLLNQYNVRLNVIGRTELFPSHVKTIVKRAEDLTRMNDGSILNICMPYASTDEITTAIESCIHDAIEDKVPTTITAEKITSRLMTTERGSPPRVDILIRTSGVTRLSDFMLWQSNEHTQIHFVDAFWPDFRLLDFVPIILQWQRAVWSGRVTPQKPYKSNRRVSRRRLEVKTE